MGSEPLLNFLGFCAFIAICGGAAAEGVWLLFRKKWAAYLAAIAAVPIIVVPIMILGFAFTRELEMTYWQFAYLVGLQSIVILPVAIACAFLGIRWRRGKADK